VSDLDHAREHRGRRRWGLVVGAVAVGLGAYALTGSGARAAAPSADAAASRPAVGSAPGLAPDGTFTMPSGATETIASLRGRPIMLWFVAGGCASCAASIPAVATHFSQLAGTGLRVVTLGLYGDFSPGKAGAEQLLSFAQAATPGRSVRRAGWEWGMASQSLSLAYDPSGIPDLYVIIGPRGRILYRNSVPVSTMGELLTEAKRIGEHTTTTAGGGGD
jgi:hypothetical protein